MRLHQLVLVFLPHLRLCFLAYNKALVYRTVLTSNFWVLNNTFCYILISTMSSPSSGLSLGNFAIYKSKKSSSPSHVLYMFFPCEISDRKSIALSSAREQNHQSQKFRRSEISHDTWSPLGENYRAKGIFLLSLKLSTRTNQNSIEFEHNKFASREKFRLVGMRPKAGVMRNFRLNIELSKPYCFKLLSNILFRSMSYFPTRSL